MPLQPLDAALGAVERVSSLVAGLAVLATAFLVVADASGRYLFAAPIKGVYETTELYFMVTMVFLALAYCQRQNGHVKVGFILDMMPPGVRRVVEVVYHLVPAALFGLMAYAAGSSAARAFEMGRWTTGVIQFPIGPSIALAAFGLGLLSLRLLLQAMQTLIAPND